VLSLIFDFAFSNVNPVSPPKEVPFVDSTIKEARGSVNAFLDFDSAFS